MTDFVIALFTSQFEIKKQLEILLIISTKSVILTKNKNNNSSQIRTLVVSYFLDGTRLDLSKTKKPKTRINTRLFAGLPYPTHWCQKRVFGRFLHSKSEVNFTSLFSLHYHKRTVPLCSEYSSANTAHKKCEKALMKLKEAIKDLI